MKLVAVEIVTRDVCALARFYQNVTGIEPIGSEDYMEFAREGVMLAVCSQQASDLFGGGAAIAGSNRSMIIAFEVADVDAELRRLEPLASAIVQKPTDRPWGHRSMLIRDPDGNLVTIFAIAQCGGDGTTVSGQNPIHEPNRDAHGNDD